MPSIEKRAIKPGVYAIQRSTHALYDFVIRFPWEKARWFQGYVKNIKIDVGLTLGTREKHTPVHGNREHSASPHVSQTNIGETLV